MQPSQRSTGSPTQTVTIRLDGLRFTRLCGGRPMITAGAQAIDYDGDVEAGTRRVESLAYVI